jgi:hypothetical protein
VEAFRVTRRKTRAVRYYELTREARFEFGRVVTQSLLRSAEDEARRHASDAFGVRRRLSERRARELRSALLALSPTAHDPRRGWTWLFRVATALWLVSIAETIAYVAAWGINAGSGVAEVAMLTTTGVWLWVLLSAPPRASAAPAVDEEGSEHGVVARVAAWTDDASASSGREDAGPADAT